MAALLTLGWAGTDRPRRGRGLQTASTLAAAVLIAVQAGAGIMEQARIDGDPAGASDANKGDDASLAPGRETSSAPSRALPTPTRASPTSRRATASISPSIR
ncbi:MAG: hypothetical protein WDN31_12230 [Hyphomicrobium sp.]